jgi:dipeptidyl aminopeptidase/acylaminoacyl peptidase
MTVNADSSAATQWAPPAGRPGELTDPQDATPPDAGPMDDTSATVPDRLFDDPTADARWRSRFTAVRLSLPDPARDEPDHTVHLSNASGRFELVTWDVATGTAVTATDRPDGTVHGTLSADGRSLWWFDDTDGDEFGIWRYQPFGAGPGSATSALPDVPPGYPAGVAVGRTLALAGFADDDGTRVHLARDGRIDIVYRHECDGGVGALATDETIWVLSHSEHGDSRYPALRALRVPDGSVIAELDDTPGKGLTAMEFSPVPGDQRLLVGHERRGRDELGIWDLSTGELTELAIDLPGDLDGGFYPDGAALLIVHTHQGRSTLHRYDLGAGELALLPAAPGVVSGALARPDGSVWYRQSSAADGWRLLLLPPGGDAGPAAGPVGGRLLIAAPDGGPAPSQPVTDIWVDGPGGRIHALLARPAGAPPVADSGHSNSALPTAFLIHGGPMSADEDSFDALRATYLDAGIAVCQVNYRGSTGYGSAWRDAITARIGHTELADIAAVHDHLITRGLVDPARSAVAGHSWGGYLTLLALGTQPSRWAVGVAGVPVADYVTAYADEMEPMRAYDRALFGGSPDEKPDAYADSSPLSWIDQVTAPVLVLAGANDPRCPIAQIDNYLNALAARGAEHAVYRFNAGHGSMVIAERLRQVACEVAYVRDRLLG